MKLSTSLIGLAICLSLAMPAWAGLLVEETFDYAAGPLDGANGGTGFAGPWVGAGTYNTYPWQFDVYDTPVIAYAGYDAQGKSVPCTSSTTWNDQLAAARGERPVTPISAASGDTLWLGLLYYRGGSYSPGGLVELADSSDSSKTLSVGTYRGPEEAVIGPDGQPTGDTANAVQFQVTLGGSSGYTDAFSYQSYGSIGLETPYFLLVKLQVTEDYTLALLDYTRSPDALPTEEPATWDAWISVPESWDVDIDTLGLMMARSNRGNWIGEVRVGTTMDDVMLVPEPATMGLLGLGGLALIRRRR